MFSDTISTLVKDYIESVDDFFITSLRFLFSIRKELFKQDNSISNELNLKRKKESIPKELLFITKSFIDRLNHHKINFSLESLTVIQLIVSNATKKEKRKKDLKLARQHRKCQETPLLIYNSFKIYSTCCSINIIDYFFRIGIYASYDKILKSI